MPAIYNDTTEMFPTILLRKMKVKRICDTIPHPPRLSDTSQDMYIAAHGNEVKIICDNYLAHKGFQLPPRT